MEPQVDHQPIGLNFSDLFGENNSTLSMERVDAFLKKVIQISSDKFQANPNQLVRVVHGKKVLWMTQEQANRYLQMEPGQNQMQQDVENALRGGLQYIRQELEILLALAMHTYSHLKEQQLIFQKDIEKIGPSLQRRQNEINEGIAETAQSETVLHVKRQRNPILDQYEEMMGEFINAKNIGDMERAAQLAKQLTEKKKDYLLITRSIEPDVRTIYFHRMNLQKTKKRIIKTQGDLCNSRKDSLKFEITELQENLESIKEQIQAAEEDGADSALVKLQHDDMYELENKEKELHEKAMEFSSLNTESQIIEKKANEIEQVIQHIQNDVLQETDQQVNVNELKRSPMQKSTAKKSTPNQNQPQTSKRVGGMHFKKSK
ncbi:hypothetical protein GF373_16160 [bacterium]|nr:hypothetical protein [bacterium]